MVNSPSLPDYSYNQLMFLFSWSLQVFTEHDVTLTEVDLRGRRLGTTLPNETTILQGPSREPMT